MATKQGLIKRTVNKVGNSLNEYAESVPSAQRIRRSFTTIHDVIGSLRLDKQMDEKEITALLSLEKKLAKLAKEHEPDSGEYDCERPKY